MIRFSGIGFAAYVAIALALAGYFTFSAVRGDLGVMERLVIQSDLARLTETRDQLQAEALRLDNLALRLSDDFLDLDLLDERARDVLGWIRADELVIR
ncbi:MAG: FtsB family cell division protein [Qingshengfaniella sp.]